MGSVKPALTHFFPGISTPHHQHKHWDAVFNEAPHSILPRINIARIAQRGVFTQPGSFAEAAPPLAWQDARHSNRKRSPQGAEQRKSARFQPVATAMTGSPQSADIPESRCHFHDRTAACLSPYAGLAFPPPHTRISSTTWSAERRRQSAQSPRRRVAENAKYPTNGPHTLVR
jgi:hypothetical protein